VFIFYQGFLSLIKLVVTQLASRQSFCIPNSKITLNTKRPPCKESFKGRDGGLLFPQPLEGLDQLLELGSLVNIIDLNKTNDPLFIDDKKCSLGRSV
jgi:hypothetical protein